MGAILKEGVKDILNLDFVLNLIYPKVCGLCERPDSYCLCKICEREVKRHTVNKIELCKDSKYINEHMYIFEYKNPIRQKIIDYKFNDKAYLCDFFVNCILKSKKICKKIIRYDIIISVPIHKKRYRQRRI